MAKKRYYSSNSMMSSGMSDNAGLPGEKVVKTWPKISYTANEGLNDGLSGIDMQIKADMKRKKTGSFPEKY